MKISALSPIQHEYSKSPVISNSIKNKSIEKSEIGNYELPDFQASIAKMGYYNISFKGSLHDALTDDELLQQKNQELFQQIKNLEERLNSLKKHNEDDKTKQARKDIEFYEDFEKNGDKYYNEAKAKAESKRQQWEDENSWWHKLFNSFEDSTIYDDAMKPYKDKRSRYYDIYWHLEHKKDLIKDANKSDAERKQTIKDLENDIATKRKLLDIRSLTTRVHNSFNARGGVNKIIAGYGNVKEKIELFIQKLEDSLTDPSVKVPTSVLLYGAPGTGKTTFLRGISAQTNGKVVVEDFNMLSNDADFESSLKKIMKRAKERYLHNGQRTILLMDDAERYLAMPIGDAIDNKLDFDEGDMTRLQSYNEHGSNSVLFKSLLDKVSEPPMDEFDEKRAAMTIFITTNYPHLIDMDLIKRYGKIEKHAVNPPKGTDFQDVLKFYVNQKKQLISIIKEYAKLEDYEDIIACTGEFTSSEKNQIKKLIKEGRINDLNIDEKSIKYTTIAKMFEPSTEDGAFSNDDIRAMVKESFSKYIKNPQVPFSAHFSKEIMSTERSISPTRMKKFIKIYNMVCQKKKFDTKTVQGLLKLSYLGHLSDEDNKNLNYQISLIQNAHKELLAKEAKGQLNEEDIKELKNLKEQVKIISNFNRCVELRDKSEDEYTGLTDNEQDELEKLENEIKQYKI